MDHDITHEISVKTDIVNNFFEGNTSFNMKGRKSGSKGIVTINSATDSRFGGAIKSIINDEGGASEGDIIAIYKHARDSYSLSVIRKNDENYKAIYEITKDDVRHTIITNEYEDDDNKSDTTSTNKKYPFNQILYGAPGTGKTYSMPAYAVAIIENEDIDFIERFYKDKRDKLLDKYNDYLNKGQIVFTTFHQSYGYEDFIQGLRPDINTDELKFKVTDGVFKSIADKALKDKDNNYIIIIDEINRGNISKIFGELITLIEDNKRWGESEQMKIKLASGDIFTVPNNLYIIGTMNTADKSISLVDAALRRRFDFVEIEPNSSLLNKEFKKFLDQINGYLKRELQSKDLLIGHSFFINKNVKDFDKIINNNIIPLLYEYFFGDEAKVKKALDGITSVSYKDDDGKEYVFELEDREVGRIKCIKKEVPKIN